MSYDAPDFRYDVFSQTITPFGIGYLTNPKEVHVIPASAPYEVHLNEIPRGDSPSTLLINIQAGADIEEVSFATPPVAGQFRAVYGSDTVPPVSIVGQGTVQFNSADAGKTIECAYYGLGAIVQNQFFNKLNDGFYGVPNFGSGLIASKIQTDNVYLAQKVVEIGDWDMVALEFKPVSVGILRSTIRTIEGIFKDDNGNKYHSITTGVDAYIYDYSLTTLLLGRLTGGRFDHVDFDSTGYNRGWVVITYEVT